MKAKRKPPIKPRRCWLCHEQPYVYRFSDIEWAAACCGPEPYDWDHELYVYGKTRCEAIARWNG